jgi:putative glutamine amidotransferase
MHRAPGIAVADDCPDSPDWRRDRSDGMYRSSSILGNGMPIRPLIALTADHRTSERHTQHLVVSTYVDAVTDVAGGLPVLVPAIGDRLEIGALLSRIDGLLLTGSPSNVHPSHYGVAPTPGHEPYDEARDATTLPLIRAAIERGVPLLAICRGFQELNVALGGSLDTEIQDLPGREDHRSPQADSNDARYAIRQPVMIARGGCLGRIVEADEIAVNSLHRQGIGRLAERLTVEAAAPDGTIEAVVVRDAPGFAVGVQWHPEYWAASDTPSRRILEAFGAAARGYAEARDRRAAAAA